MKSQAKMLRVLMPVFINELLKFAFLRSPKPF